MTLQFCVLLLFSGLAFGSESIPPIVGEGLTRVPENGQAKIGDELKCLKDGQEVSDIEWVLIKDDKRSVITSEDGLSSIKATEQAKYQCKIDEETYAEFVISEEKSSALHFRVDKFEKSYAVVEQEDLKIECKISNRTDAIDIKNDIRIKWYMYDVTGESIFTSTSHYAKIQLILRFHFVKSELPKICLQIWFFLLFNFKIVTKNAIRKMAQNIYFWKR